MHRLDQISAKKPAKLLYSKSLTLDFSRQQVWPVFLPYTSRWIAGRQADDSPRAARLPAQCWHRPASGHLELLFDVPRRASRNWIRGQSTALQQVPPTAAVKGQIGFTNRHKSQLTSGMSLRAPPNFFFPYPPWGSLNFENCEAGARSGRGSLNFEKEHG